MNNIVVPHSRTNITEDDIQAVADQLRSHIVSYEEKSHEFERKLAHYIGVNYAYATSSGTLAVYLSLMSLGIKPDDDIIIPSYVCTDVLSAVWQIGANPILVDIDDNFNINYESVEERITQDTRAIICPHMFGLPANIKPLLKLDIPIIVDCAHSIGAEIDGQRVGSFGNLSTFSFAGIKMLTTGEGGMVLSNEAEIGQQFKRFLNPDYELGQFKLKFPLSSIQAAIGLSQFARLDKMITRRREIARHYNEELSKFGNVRLPVTEIDGRCSVFYRYCIRLNDTDINAIIGNFYDNDIIVRHPIVKLLHSIKWVNGKECPNSDSAYRETISLPLYPDLTEEEEEKVINVAQNIFSKF